MSDKSKVSLKKQDLSELNTGAIQKRKSLLVKPNSLKNSSEIEGTYQ